MQQAIATSPASKPFIEALAANLKSGKVELPSFPDVVMRVREALEDDDCTTDKLVKLISAEPVLAARLLKIANSPALRPAGDPITDLNMAVNRIGRSMVRSSAMTFAMEQMKNARDLELVKEKLNALWERSTYVAALSYVLAKKNTPLNPDEAMFVGLMHGIGRMYVLVQAEGHPSILEDDAELTAIMDKYDSKIGAKILQTWDMSEHIASAVRDYRDQNRANEGAVDYTDVLILAFLLFEFVHAEGDNEFVLDDVPASAKLNLGAADMINILTESKRQIHSLQRALGQ